MSVKKIFAYWFALSCDFLQIDFLYAIHIGRIVFSYPFFETDWVESTQCDYREILR